MMGEGRRLVSIPSFSMLSRLSLMTAGMVSCCGRPTPICDAGSVFVATPSQLQSLPGSRARTHRTKLNMNAQSARRTDMSDQEEAGIAVNHESWYLGDGDFAKQYLDNEERISALKGEKEFFSKRSLSVYDQMREASMLLLAQQRLLAAEEAREHSSKPKFVPAEGAKVARERQSQRDATSGLLETPQTPKASEIERDWSASGAVLPTASGMLSGRTLGIGGLDEELEEIRRRVCVPLAAPAELLQDLGITPVRGLLLYGPPGCGKSLLAKRLSTALTRRPPTVVSGPEVLERFVGSSEANVRALFDFPPDVPGGNKDHQANELHVIVLDEFDSIGQKRGGGDDGGDRVRDSVVNQLLARMDGFQELERPTLVVALTNRIDLLDKALLRPGRFEVQVEIPGPDMEGRGAILRIHTKRMYDAGRIAMPPADDAGPDVGGYDSLMSSLASVTEGFTGAELAGLVRAAASYALERTVSEMTRIDATQEPMEKMQRAAECRLSAEDFGRGLADVLRSKVPGEGPTSVARSSSEADADSGIGRSIAPGSPGAAKRADVSRTAKGTKGVGDDLWDAESVAEGGGAGGAGGAESKASKSAAAAAAAAAVAAVRSESDIRGSLSEEDLVAVQELLHRKTNERQGENSMLLDAVRTIAQRRNKGRGDSAKDHTGDVGEGREEGGEDGDPDARSMSSRPRKLKEYEHTGWFHTYE